MYQQWHRPMFMLLVIFALGTRQQSLNKLSAFDCVIGTQVGGGQPMDLTGDIVLCTRYDLGDRPFLFCSQAPKHCPAADAHQTSQTSLSH